MSKKKPSAGQNESAADNITSSVEDAPFLLKEVAGQVGVSGRTIRRWMDDGKVPITRKYDCSHKLRFSPHDVELLKKHRTSIHFDGGSST